jgi:hypothetical protein
LFTAATATTTLFTAAATTLFTALTSFVCHNNPPCCLFLWDPAVSKDNLMNLRLHFFRTKVANQQSKSQEQCHDMCD